MYGYADECAVPVAMPDLGVAEVVALGFEGDLGAHYVEFVGYLVGREVIVTPDLEEGGVGRGRVAA